jgi:uncharacterized protein YoxC
MDALLLALQNVSEQLLPILGAVALIFVCILLKKLWQFIEQLTATVKELDPTIKLADQSLEKVQAPLDTAVKYSHTLDKVHDKTGEILTKVTDFASDNVENLKNQFNDKLNKDEASETEVNDNE